MIPLQGAGLVMLATATILRCLFHQREKGFSLRSFSFGRPFAGRDGVAREHRDASLILSAVVRRVELEKKTQCHEQSRHARSL